MAAVVGGRLAGTRLALDPVFPGAESCFAVCNVAGLAPSVLAAAAAAGVGGTAVFVGTVLGAELVGEFVAAVSVALAVVVGVAEPLRAESGSLALGVIARSIDSEVWLAGGATA